MTALLARLARRVLNRLRPTDPATRWANLTDWSDDD